MVVYRRPGQGIFYFGGTLLPQKTKIGRVSQSPGSKVQRGKRYRNRHATEYRCVVREIARRVDVVRHVRIYGRPRRRTYLLLLLLLLPLILLLY